MTTQAAEPQAPAGRRVATPIDALAPLVGAHPDALLQFFGEGRATDPAELGPEPRGRILAIVPGAEMFLALRPILRALASDRLPWRGKIFDHGGSSGANVLFGRTAFRFQSEVAPSAIDGRPSLVLDYGLAAYRNPWPVRTIRDELRTVGKGVAIGPAFLVGGGAPRAVLWFGLEMA
jgi:hypothetical protein